MQVSRRAVLVAAAVAWACCPAAPPAAAPPAARLAEAPALGERAVARQTLFDFHSGVWLNLHQVLYRQGMKRRGEAEGDRADGLAAVDAAAFEPEERRAWDSAVDHYATAISHRNPVMDQELAAIDDALAKRELAGDLRGAAVPLELAAVLEGALPVYRSRFWTDHDRANRAWVASVEPHLQRHGSDLARELAKSFRKEWPSEPLRVDVTSYAPPPGAAYTTFGPPHITVSAADSRNQGHAALEILMHEASHLIIRNVRDALARELSARGKEEPSLWHALLFFTTGEAVRRRLPGYQPYAEREGLYTGRWAAYRTALEAHWRPYLTGASGFEDAIGGTVSAL